MFLSLLLAYLHCDQDDYELITYLESKQSSALEGQTHCCSWFSSFVSSQQSQQPKARLFLRQCKFGTLQVRIYIPSLFHITILIFFIIITLLLIPFTSDSLCFSTHSIVFFDH